MPVAGALAGKELMVLLVYELFLHGVKGYDSLRVTGAADIKSLIRSAPLYYLDVYYRVMSLHVDLTVG
jgi:hypothetical protein